MVVPFLALALAQQNDGVPRIVYELPVMGGQREIVLGASQTESVVLNGVYDHDVPSRHIATPGNTGGAYVDSWTPGGTDEERLGQFDCTATADTLFGKSCTRITTTAEWIQKMGRKPHQVTWSNYAKQEWWVAPDGTILRNFSSLQTPQGTQTGDCTYGKHSVQRRYTDIRNATSYGEIFPSCGMDALNAQFKPMIVDGKLALRDKDYTVLNPLTGGLDQYSVHSAGTFKGKLLDAEFMGRVFEVDGPANLREKAYIDNSGDLIRVELSAEKYFSISTVPSSHLDEFGHPKRLSGGG